MEKRTLWFIIRDYKEDRPTWAWVSLFKTYHIRNGTILSLANHYKGDTQNNKEHTNDHTIFKKGKYNKEHQN